MGHRSGDPLLPYLFLLAMNVFTTLYIQSNIQNIGIRVHLQAPTIDHLLFIDDCLVFAKATLSDCLSIQQCLHLFYQTTGLTINYSKSSLFIFPRVLPTTQRKIAHTLHTPSKDLWGHCLGTPMFCGRPIGLLPATQRKIAHTYIHLGKIHRVIT